MAISDESQSAAGAAFPSHVFLMAMGVLLPFLAIVGATVARRRAVSTEGASETKPEGENTGEESKPDKARASSWLRIVLAATLACAAVATLLSRQAGSRTTPESAEESVFEEWCHPVKDLVGAYGDLGNYSITIRTSSARAQALFNQGVVLRYAFTQGEAKRNFEAAIEEDPECAMCYWGLAYNAGPYLNLLLAPPNTTYPHTTYTNIAEGLELANTALQYAAANLKTKPDSPRLQLEKAYIEAMRERYLSKDNVDERYIAATQKLVDQHPSDVDSKVLLAEALLMPISWDYYMPDGTPRENARKAQELLDQALKNNPDHPLALHLYIHLTESLTPGVASTKLERRTGAARGEFAADRLAAIAPGASHLVHVPGHTYIRTGRYSDAAETNVVAANLDYQYASHCFEPYLPEHNLNMLAFAASMANVSAWLWTAPGTGARAQGQAGLAAGAAHQIQQGMPRLSKRAAANKSEYTTLTWVLVRFGKWDQLERRGPPPAFPPVRNPPYAQFAWELARLLALANHAAYAPHGMSFAPQLSVVEGALRAAAADVPADAPSRPGPGNGIYSSESAAVVAVLLRVADARLALLHKRVHQAVEHLQDAVALQDNVTYMEPPYLHTPVRQCLGKVLLDAGRAAEAEEVYRADLAHFPANGWSLLGLQQSLQAQGGAAKEGEAKAVEMQFKTAWRRADAPLESSCPAFERTPYLFGHQSLQAPTSAR